MNTDMKILVVDDEEASLVLLKRILLRAGYKHILTCPDPQQVMQLVETFEPDLLLLDQNMPYMSGMEVIRALEGVIEREGYFPILMLTADPKPEVKKEALATGAKDFVHKPLDSQELLLRVANLLETRTLHKALQVEAMSLERKVEERTRQLESAHVEMLVRLARAAEYRDDESGEHIWRVAQNSARVAEAMGRPPAEVTLLLRAARLHDVGKIAIPDGVLFKPGRLTPQEFELVKNHTEVGANLLSGGNTELMTMAETIALTHHERWDGSGYPQGLAREAIPLESRILAICDTFDAMIQDRSYRRAIPVRDAVADIQSQRGKQFDPRVVDAFVEVYERGDLEVARSLAVS